MLPLQVCCEQLWLPLEKFPCTSPVAMLVCASGDMTTKRKAAPYSPEKLPAAKRKQPEKLNVDDHLFATDAIAVEKTGPTNGMPVIRRIASLNAEVALSLMISESCEGSSPPLSPSEAFAALCDVEEGLDLPSESSALSEWGASDSQVTYKVHSPCVVAVDKNDEPVSSLQLQLSSSDDSAASSISGSDTEEEDTPCSRTEPCAAMTIGAWKKPRVEVVDCKRSITCVKRPQVKSTTKSSTVQSTDVYVKRLASLNARACVAAYLEPERITKRPRSGPLSNSVLSLSPAHEASPVSCDGDIQVTESDGNTEGVQFVESKTFSDGKTKKEVQVDAEPPVSEQFGVISSAHDFGVVLKLLSTQQQQGSQSDLEEVPAFNTLGLLYDGRTIHPSYPVFLNSEGESLSQIIPVIVPSIEGRLAHYVNTAREQQRQLSVQPKAMKVESQT